MTLRRKLCSVFTALALVISMFTLLPKRAFTVTAEGGALNVRAAYIPETGQVTVTWNSYGADFGYTLYYFNDCVSGENAGKMMKMPEFSSGTEIAVYAPTSYTLPKDRYFGNQYGNGGQKFQVLVVAHNISGTTYSEYSNVFKTNVPMLPAPKVPSLYTNGLVTWENDDVRGCYTNVKLFEHSTHRQLRMSDVSVQYFDESDVMTEGTSYYAVLQDSVERSGQINYRNSPVVYTNAQVFRKRTGILGLGWDGPVLYWTRYPKATKYHIDIMANNFFHEEKAGETDLYSANFSNETAVMRYDIRRDLKKIGIGPYRIVITAYNYQGEQISDPTTPDIYFFPGARLGDVNDDGAVDVKDLTILARALAGWDGCWSRIAYVNADITDDGSVTVDDYTILARALAGWSGYAKKYGIILG
ncbi:MAG: dockerin type I repeat-containing protein [Ruminococcus sp.]|nr:dockerin type I repeat-containing protein [Ruminococcus sp.]